jgi:hypothetical protein
MRLAVSLVSLVVFSLPARAAEKPPAPAYVSASELRSDSAVGPNPFAWAPTGATPVLPASDVAPPANVAHLALLRPYTVTFNAPAATVVEPANPFLPGGARPASKMDVSKEAAADWYHPWPVTWSGTAWDALETAWKADPVAARKLFRDATRSDWPLDGVTAAREADRLLAARWVEARWNAAVRESVAAWKSANNLRGPLLARAPLDGSLSALSAGDAANHPAPVLAPRVTGDAWVNAYGVGFLLRLTADLGSRIPWPTFDLSNLPATDVPWATAWLDEAVRNGVAGLTILPPADAAARDALQSAVKPLAGPNVYLPPPSEIGILVSRDTVAREPGAWVSVFRTYAALRAAGLWPNFVADDDLRSGAASLARFDVLVVPAARWTDAALPAAFVARATLGGIIVVTDPFAFRGQVAPLAGWASALPRRDDPALPEAGPVLIVPETGSRVLATFHDGTPAITERRVGDGYIMASALPLASPDGAWASFWRDVARRASVPRRPWLDAVTMENMGTVTGTYKRPTAE